MIHQIFGIDKGDTLGTMLDRRKGVGPGFDFIRIVLALYIFYGHALWVSGGQASVIGVGVLIQGPAGSVGGALAPVRTLVTADGFSGWTRPFHVAAVPVFFALSGFLVIGSALRLRAVTTFLAFRLLRILPALVVETLLCAFLVGGISTKLSLGNYFTDPLFFRYLGNVVGIVSFRLPAVFLSKPVEGVVNANLWTLPSEFHCYLLTALLMATGIIYMRSIFTPMFIITSVILIASSLLFGYALTIGILSPIAIVYYFFTGVFFYLWRDVIPMRIIIFIIAAASSYVLLLDYRSAFIAPIPVTYCMVFVGMIRIPKLPLFSRGDYSYGLYLYGFPICQLLVACFPIHFVGHRYSLLLVGLIAALAWAAFSWHFVEVHALRLKRYLPERVFPRHKGAVPVTT